MNLKSSSIENIQKVRAAAEGKKVVFVSGFFNVLHPGHLRLLRFAKECGDYLVVGLLHSSLSRKPMLSESLRLEGIRSTSWVDHAFVLEEAPDAVIAELRPAVVVKGNEFSKRDNPEHKIISAYGGELIFSSGEFSFSSVEALKSEFRRLSFSDIEIDREFPVRRGFSVRGLDAALDRMKQVNVLVIGDTIVDEYVNCDPVGLSQEDPTVVVTPVYREEFLGAAGIVAAHAASLGGKVDFFSVLGKDRDAKFTRDQLEKFGVNHFLIEDSSRITTRKQRFRAAGKTLLRVNHFRQHEISEAIQKKILKELTIRLQDKQLLVFSDFNYGCLPQELVDQIIQVCRGRGILMVADSQSSSQVGDISRYRGMDLVTPTEREARLAVHDFRSGIVQMTRSLQEKSQARNIFVTMGKEGVFIHSSPPDLTDWTNDKIPAMNKAPVDAAGAGDSLLISSALALTAGLPIWESAYLGSLAAACQVARLGNIPLKPSELRTEIESG